MPAPKNEFKAALKSGKTQIGCWAGMAHAYPTEMLGTCGFDWILVDGEHAPNNHVSILAQLQALAASPSHSVVRLPVGDEVLVKQYLDIGAQSLLIPMIESADEAKAMVDAAYYPPRGKRGVGSALARASQFSKITDYVTTADDEICILLQVESVKGVDALDGILATKGVDGVFIGPADLAADMGYPGQLAHPEVRGKIINTLERIKAGGVAAGILSSDEEFTRQCIDMKLEFIAVGIDVVEFVKTLRALAEKYKQS